MYKVETAVKTKNMALTGAKRNKMKVFKSRNFSDEQKNTDQ